MGSRRKPEEVKSTAAAAGALVEDRRAPRRKRSATVERKWWEPQTASKNLVHVHSKAQFDAVLATANGNPHTPIPVVVDFFATWCNACRGFFPKWIKTVAEEQKVLFVCVEYDENKDWVTAMGVEKLPMVMFFNGSSTPLEQSTVSMAPLRVQAFKRKLALHTAPRSMLPPAGGKLPDASDIVRLHPVTFTWRSEAKEVMLAGEPFGSWSTFVSLKRNEESGVFEYTQTLAAGTYRFKWIVDGQWQASPNYPQDVDVKDNVNNVITIREADWPMLWRVSNASLDYTHGTSPLTGWPCVTQNGDAAVTMPPAANPTGESSFDCSTPMAASNANADARPSPQVNNGAIVTPAPAADAQVVKQMVAAELAPLMSELAEIKELLRSLAKDRKA